VRHTPLLDEADREPLPSAALPSPRVERLAQDHRRVEATALGTDARFIVTNLQGRGKSLYEKVFWRVEPPRTSSRT
jgi:hypothetical protein